MSERFLSPSETARRLGVGVRALRLYERKGLVHPKRTEAGWRVYGPGEIERLHQVLTLKSLGLSLTRITQLLGGREADLSALLALQEDVLSVRISDLQKARKAVQAARAKLSREGAPHPGRPYRSGQGDHHDQAVRRPRMERAV